MALTERLCPHSLAHPTLPQVTFVKSEEFRSEQQMLADTEVKQLVNLAPPGGFEAGVGIALCGREQVEAASPMLSVQPLLCPTAGHGPEGTHPERSGTRGGVSAIWETRHLHGTRSGQERARSNTLIHSPS